MNRGQLIIRRNYFPTGYSIYPTDHKYDDGMDDGDNGNNDDDENEDDIFFDYLAHHARFRLKLRKKSCRSGLIKPKNSVKLDLFC